MGGQKILDGLRDAVAGNFARVTIDGQVWVRLDNNPLYAMAPDVLAAMKSLLDDRSVTYAVRAQKARVAVAKSEGQTL